MRLTGRKNPSYLLTYLLSANEVDWAKNSKLLTYSLLMRLTGRKTPSYLLTYLLSANKLFTVR